MQRYLSAGLGLLALAKSASQHVAGDDGPTPHISVPLFSSLERMARLVDITYCVGTTGVSYPFTCASRCREFPTLTLVTTWNTGVLMSDSCGYIAVDHGKRRPGSAAAGLSSKATGEAVTSGDDDDDVDGPGEPAIVVAFRGTYSITNTVIDLSTVPQEYVPYPSPDDGDGDNGKPPGEPEHKCTNCTVHMGFLESWRQARKLVLPELARLRQIHPDYPVHLVGHSLGGAVAALAALELRVSLGRKDVLVTTFGEPRVGNQGLADFLDTAFALLDGQEAHNDDNDPARRRYRRVTHADDPVPLLPPAEMGFRSHAGELYIAKAALSPEAEDVRVCSGDQDARCSAGGDQNYFESLATEEPQQQQQQQQLLLPGEDAQTGSSGDDTEVVGMAGLGIPTRLKLWQLFFAHRDYFWRLGLCVPGGDPANWGRSKYPGYREEL